MLLDCWLDEGLPEQDISSNGSEGLPEEDISSRRVMLWGPEVMGNFLMLLCNGGIPPAGDVKLLKVALQRRYPTCLIDGNLLLYICVLNRESVFYIGLRT